MIAALALAALGQAARSQSTPLDVSLEDLVRASAGRLLLYASQAGPSGSTLSLSGIEAVDFGSATRLVVCAAALARAEQEGRTPPPIIYKREHYRGVGKGLGGRFGTQLSHEQLLAYAIRDDERAATDILLGWMGPRFQSWMTARKLPSFGSIQGTAARDRIFLQALDPRLASLSDERLARYWRDAETTAAVPSPLPTDLRRDPSFIRKQSEAWRTLRSRRLDHGSLKDITRLTHELFSGPVLSPTSRRELKRLLMGVRSAAGTRYLPLNQGVRTYGLHGQAGSDQTAVTVVETAKGRIVITAHARGYASRATAEHFLSLLTRGAARRLAPGGVLKPSPIDAEARNVLPRSIRDLELRLLPPKSGVGSSVATAAVVSRSRFTVGETAELVVDCAEDTKEGCLELQWHSPRSWSHRIAIPVAAGQFIRIREPRKITQHGRHMVEVWWNGLPVRQILFQAIPAKGK